MRHGATVANRRCPTRVSDTQENPTLRYDGTKSGSDFVLGGQAGLDIGARVAVTGGRTIVTAV